MERRLLQRERGYTRLGARMEGSWTPKPEEEPYKPPKIILATDLHYQSASCQDDGEAFQKLYGGERWKGDPLSSGALGSVY